MAEARSLLVQMYESVERVWARVGYDDPAYYFARRFWTTHKAKPAFGRNANRWLSPEEPRMPEKRFTTGTTSLPSTNSSPPCMLVARAYLGLLVAVCLLPRLF